LPQCSAKTGDKVKDLFDNVVLCALEGQAESRAAGTTTTTTTTPTVQATPPGQRTTAEEDTKKGKEKANDDDVDAEHEVQPDEGKFTRPGLSTGEKGAFLCVCRVRACRACVLRVSCDIFPIGGVDE
jgi:hypothetical protein